MGGVKHLPAVWIRMQIVQAEYFGDVDRTFRRTGPGALKLVRTSWFRTSVPVPTAFACPSPSALGGSPPFLVPVFAV